MTNVLAPNTLVRINADDVLVTGRITHISPRQLGIALVAPYQLLFNEYRPAYFSRFLLGDGFLGPDGEPFVHEQLLKLHRAAHYLHAQVPRVAEALAQDPDRCQRFLEHLDPLVGNDAPATPEEFRSAVLRIEQELGPAGAAKAPMLSWQQPFLKGLTALQANVLLHRWLRKGPFDLLAPPPLATAPHLG